MIKLVSTNPAKGYEKFSEVDISSDTEIHQKVINAHKARLVWKEKGVQARIEHLRPIQEEFIKRREEMILLETQETGRMPIVNF